MNQNSFSSSIAADVYGANKIYMLKRIVFHTESEHTINLKRYDLEMQLQHEDGSGADNFKGSRNWYNGFT